jgi:hypothetical protein
LSSAWLAQLRHERRAVFLIPAGLDAAVNAGIPIGGYCPKGRLAEDGVIPDKYPMIEMDSPESHYRTEKNVLESDGTLIFNNGELTEGTGLAYDFTVKYGNAKAP